MTGANDIFFLSGQTTVDENGQARFPGDMKAQSVAALDNLEQVLAGAGLDLNSVVKTNIYVTDLEGFFSAASEIVGRFQAAGS